MASPEVALFPLVSSVPDISSRQRHSVLPSHPSTSAASEVRDDCTHKTKVQACLYPFLDLASNMY